MSNGSISNAPNGPFHTSVFTRASTDTLLADLDISPLTFIGRVDSELAFRHVAVGLAKAAVFGGVIALIGCRAGMTVRRDARSIGMKTTSTVVQGIVWVILLDALFAVLLQELHL